MGNHSEFVAGRLAEQKQLIHTSQTAAQKTLSAPESPFSFVTSRTNREREEWDCVYDQNLNISCFVPYEKHFLRAIRKPLRPFETAPFILVQAVYYY
jgi:hypothetical protein